MSYKVRLQNFEGPFDLLVYLIENARMNIYDIQVSDITDQYLRYIDEMQHRDVMMAAEFMVLAATLIDIKSKMLLPRSMPGQQGGDYEDPRTELVQKLLEYKKYKAVSDFLTSREEWAANIFEKPREDLSPYTGDPDEFLKLDIHQFVRAFNDFITKKRKVDEIRRNYDRDQRQRMTTEVRMDLMAGILARDPARIYSFYELVPDLNSRYDAALSFVSLLEMLKQRRVDAGQKSLFGEITVKATPYLHTGYEEPETTEEESRHDQ